MKFELYTDTQYVVVTCSVYLIYVDNTSATILLNINTTVTHSLELNLYSGYIIIYCSNSKYACLIYYRKNYQVFQFFQLDSSTRFTKRHLASKIWFSCILCFPSETVILFLWNIFLFAFDVSPVMFFSTSRRFLDLNKTPTIIIIEYHRWRGNSS